MNIEDSVADPLDIQHNEELVFNNVRSEEKKIEENGNEFERNIIIFNYHFSFLYFSIIFYLDDLTKVNVILIMMFPVLSIYYM